MLSLVLWTKASGHNFYWLDRTRAIWNIHEWGKESIVCLYRHHHLLLLQLHILGFIFWKVRHGAFWRGGEIVLKIFMKKNIFFLTLITCSPPHWSLRASSVAYFFTYSATFFLYSSGLRRVYFSTASSRKYHDSPVKIHCCCISIERICGVGVCQKLGQERLEYIGEIIERCPGLIDDIQTHSSWHLVNVGMIHLRNNEQSQDLSCY